MRIGLCQIDSQWESRSETRRRIERIVESWAGRADCLAFPEMGLSGFSMNSDHTTLVGEDHNFFSDLSIRIGATILYGGVEDSHNCVFSAVPGKSVKTVYRKRHLFAYGGERECYTPGTETSIVEVGGMRLALAICYDLRFSYHFWSQAEQCDGYIVIASWPELRREHWLTLLRARAIENQAFVIGVNRVGSDPKLSYSGDSAVYGPFGERRLECGAEEGIYCCDIDPAYTSEIRSKYRFIEDRLA